MNDAVVIRAFIAVELAPSIIQNIDAAIDRLRPRLTNVRWVAPGNIHLTVKFLGDIPESQVDDLVAALTPVVRPFPRCTINAKGLGVFLDVKRPRIIWVGLASDALVALAAKVQACLLPLGFEPEKRSFTPHLTIGRWRQSDRAPKDLPVALANWRSVDFGQSEVNEIVLFQSILKPQGAEYRKLKVIQLGSQP
ncbi:MAG: RNA 2',3'-cyclic phosphodiesterase [Deltaproteobacteria bacterium]|nr:RNA 2',3'-cyclic phosphodiesterase [Deltaproteobacteria bacterium]